MKILLVHYRYFISGGPERYLFNIKEALEELGHTVIPFSTKNSRNIYSEYEKYFVENIGNSDEIFVNKYSKTLKTYIDLMGREFYSFKVKRALEKLIIHEKPEVCYLLVYKRTLSPSVIDVCKKYNIPVINRISDYNTVCGAGSLYRAGKYCDLCLQKDIHCLKFNCVKGSRLFSLVRFLSTKLHKHLNIAKKIDTYICTNQYMAEMMCKYGYDKSKLKIVPTFFSEDEEIRSWDKTNNPDPSLIKFLFIGNIDETKGIYDLLEAIALLARDTSNFHLYVVGGLHMEENERVLHLIHENKLTEYITFVPFMTSREVFRYYLNINVTILPARWVENLPNTLVESIYFGRPVVVPEFGSFLYITDQSVAFRYEALSSTALYQCMLNICNHPEQIAAKSQSCRAFYEKNFSKKVHIDLLLDALSTGENMRGKCEMKIYEIGTGYTPIPAKMGAATEIVVEELTKSMMKQHEQVMLIDIKAKNRLSHQLPIIEIPVPSIFTGTDTQLGLMHKFKRVVYSISLAFRLKKLVSKQNDLVILHFHNQYNMYFFLKLVPAKIRKKCKLVYTIHSYIWHEEWNKIKDVISKRYFQEVFCMKHADLVYVLNENTYETLVKHIGISEDKINLIANGVNTEIYCPQDKMTVNKLKRELNIDGKKVFIQVGSVCDRKNQLGALELLLPLMQEDNNIMFLYAGGIISMEYQKKIEEFSEEHDISDRVLYLGDLKPGEELNKYYNLADAMIFPSKSEAFSLVIIEAMSAGIPVFIHDNLRFRLAKQCFRYRNEIDFVSLIKSEILDEGKRVLNASAARRAVEQTYSWDTIAKCYCEGWCRL